MKKSVYLEDYNQVLYDILIVLVKVTNFDYKHFQLSVYTNDRFPNNRL